MGSELGTDSVKDRLRCRVRWAELGTDSVLGMDWALHSETGSVYGMGWHRRKRKLYKG